MASKVLNRHWIKWKLWLRIKLTQDCRLNSEKKVKTTNSYEPPIRPSFGFLLKNSFNLDIRIFLLTPPWFLEVIKYSLFTRSLTGFDHKVKLPKVKGNNTFYINRLAIKLGCKQAKNWATLYILM